MVVNHRLAAIAIAINWSSFADLPTRGICAAMKMARKCIMLDASCTAVRSHAWGVLMQIVPS